jgi:hypothetical protein
MATFLGSICRPARIGWITSRQELIGLPSCQLAKNLCWLKSTGAVDHSSFVDSKATTQQQENRNEIKHKGTPCIVLLLVSHTYAFAIDHVEQGPEEPSEPTQVEDANTEQEQGKPRFI